MSGAEAVIGHMKTDGYLGRCYLKRREGDAANVILTAVVYNLRLVLPWLLGAISGQSRIQFVGRGSLLVCR